MGSNNTDLVHFSKTPDDSTKLDAKLAEAHYNRAIGYLKIGQLELSTQAAMDALEISSDYGPAHALLEPLKQEYFIRGLTFLKENKVNQALYAFQCAVAIDPNFVDAHCELGSVYLRQGELKMAQTAIDEALKSDLNYLPARDLLVEVKHACYTRGLSLLSEGRCNEAISNFQNAVVIDANFAEAHCELGRAYLRQLDALEKDTGKIRGNCRSERALRLVLATKSVEEALRIDPNCELARGLSYFLGDLWLEEDTYYDLLDSLTEELHLGVKKLVESGKTFTNIEGALEFLFSMHYYSQEDYDKAEDYDRDVWLAATVGSFDQYARYRKAWADLFGLVYDPESDKYTLHDSGNLLSQIQDWPWRMIVTMSLYLEAERDIREIKSSFDERVTKSLGAAECLYFPENLYFRALRLHQHCKQYLASLTKDHKFFWDVLELVLEIISGYYSAVSSMIEESYYHTPEAYQQYLQEEAAEAYYQRESEPNYLYEDNFIREEAEPSYPYEEEMWLEEYQEIMSEQDGFYPSYSWYEEYDMLAELEGIEHY